MWALSGHQKLLVNMICVERNVFKLTINTSKWLQLIEAVSQRCSVKNVFLEISQNSQENTCARVSFLIKLQAWGSCEFCEISKNTFSSRTLPEGASEFTTDPW